MLPCLSSQDAVLLVASATGDEEVAALGANLHGILLRQDLPHLSHLGAPAPHLFHVHPGGCRCLRAHRWG